MADQQAQVEIEVVEASDSAVPPAPPPPAPPNQLFLGKKRGGSDLPSPKGRLPYLSELLAGRRKKRPSTQHENPGPASTPDVDSPHYELGRSEPTEVVEIKVGNLWKSSQSRKEGSQPGPVRVRRFRLTEEALEYFQQFSQVKIRRNFPLTSIENIEYPLPSPTEATTFRLLFATYCMSLVAESEEEAKDWVEKIKEAWQKWQLPSGKKTEEDSLNEAQLTRGKKLPPVLEEDEEGEEHKDQQPPSPSKPLSKNIQPIANRPRSNTIGGTPLFHQDTLQDFGTYDRRKKIGRRAHFFRDAVNLAPRLVMSKRQAAHDKTSFYKLHDDYAMIKYPQRWWTLPSEKLFKVDKHNLQILWRRNTSSRFTYSNSLSFHRIVEIREGQLTEEFDRFPYEEVESQSFSLMFEEESGGGKYVRLRSLNLICDHPDHYHEWMEGLRTLIPSMPQCTIFPYTQDKHRNTDPTLLWLKRLWSSKAYDNEITQKDAISIIRKMNPHISPEDAKWATKEAHSHQFRHTFHYGAALRFDGFALLFNILCEKQGSRLFTIFRQYAKTHPNLGMTMDEFREFLVEECYWERRQCTKSAIQELVSHHDKYNNGFKKLVAENKPQRYQQASNLFSFAGFLSFLRSKDNPAINLEHETVYQDMTQPLSHYFINSSHNTYLDADQLKGSSSNDAYIRALLQGCRCIEIDCWDDTFNVAGSGEPIIYHGYTLTTKLPFREVIQTIKEYAFNTSHYPVIISIENHCSPQQQSKMAKIFLAVMGDVLALENLVELEERERLPSPQELQGKIILKGSFKEEKSNTKERRKTTVAQTQKGVQKPRALSSASQSSQEEPSLTNISRAESDDCPTSPTDVTGPEGTVMVFTPPVNKQPYNRQSLKHYTRSLEKSGEGSVFLAQDDQELIFEETAEDLKKMYVYCRAVSIKPWSWKRQCQTTVSEMFSIGELSAIRHCRDSPKEMLACTERQLVRTYPKGVRFDSSNYNPLPMWNCGMQMVALNYQSPDVWMHLNQGLFRLNGGCGYVLKPEVMRRHNTDGSTSFDPYMTEPNPDVPTVEIEIELLSGQRLCPWKKKCTQVHVEIQLYGINKDCGGIKPASHHNSFWPQWPEGAHKYQARILMPELCLVYFKVEVQLRKRQLYGQNCIPLISLKPGIKFIPLRTSGGELIPESGLFVRIKKGEETIRRPSFRLQRQTSVEEDDDFVDLGDVDVMESISPSLMLRGNIRKEQSVSSSAQSSRPMSSPSVLTSFDEHEPKVEKLQVVAEVHSEADDVSATRAIPKEEQKVLTVEPSSVPVKFLQEEEEEGYPEKEFHLRLKSQRKVTFK